ncbi:retention module-containing protein [Pseudomonas sp. GD03944]|uniref:retention module-containing protein n=1 Tax=Pseudomonas sp. GD03944 TaxID=2975409 RepID=UPI0024488581|nr:retention module-containing protein [Pseudomonas sp. GD03944]MDH1262527.1 retention module-containing protein [Pseudomonas sp. GD03944]
MATSIGVVSQVVGEVFAVAGDGTRRPLVEGDRVFAGEQLVTGAAGAVAVNLGNGQQLTLGRDSSVNLTVQMLAQNPDNTVGAQDAAPVAPSANDLTDVEQLQAAIEAGADPTMAGEATAAGPGAGGGAGGVGGGHSFVLLDAVGGAIDPVIGFPTAGFNTPVEFPDPDPVFTDDPQPFVDGIPTGGTASNAVDEDGLPDGIAGGVNDAAGEDVEVSGSLGYSFGPDGIGSFAWSTAGLDDLGVTSGGMPLTYTVSDDGLTLTAFAGDSVVFTLQVTNIATGEYTFTLEAPIDHAAPSEGGSDENDLDFPFGYTITDGNGTPASGSLTLTVNDDSPAQQEGERPVVRELVHEDALADGNGEDTDPAQTTTVSAPAGTLSALVNFGADGPGGISLSGSEAALQSLYDLGLTSGEVDLEYSVVVDPETGVSTLTAMAGDAPIFTLEVSPDGSYTFTLEGKIDHPEDDGVDSETLGDSSIALDFSALLVATDYDGDTLEGGFGEGSFVIDIEDDVPVQTGSAGDRPVVHGLVHEDALDDGNGEDTDPAQTLVAEGGPGSLDALVSFGADGRGGFALSTDTGTLEALLLESGGVPLVYSVVVDEVTGISTLTATAGEGGAPVFTLEVNTDGSYTFTLEGKIDHPEGDGVDGETLGDSSLALDFSGLLIATDGDGDPLADGFDEGTFVIDIEDDVPVQTGGAGDRPVVTGLVHEDALGDGNGEDTDPAQTLVVEGGPGTLDALVSFGADGRGGFALSADTGTLEALLLESGGVPLVYTVVVDEVSGISTLTATAGEGGAPVFTLEVNTDGSYTFTLEGKIDHPEDDGVDSETLGDSSLALDFSGMLIATDGDGDPILDGFDEGTFVIDIEDDVPVQSGTPGDRPVVTGLVHEDALGTGNGESGNVPTQTLVATGGIGALDALVSFGADGRGSFELSEDTSSLEGLNLESGGVPLVYSVVVDPDTGISTLTATAGVDGPEIFILEVNADGSYTFTLEGKIDHPEGNGVDSETLGDSSLALDFSGLLIAKDGDGDPLADAFEPGSFVIDIEDDVPVQAGEEGDRPVVRGLVHEDALGMGNGESGNVPTQTLIATGGAGALDALVSFGADGKGGFALSADTGTLEAQQLQSNQVDLEYDVVVDDITGVSTLTATAGGADIFTLVVNPDGSYTFTLKGPIDHPLDNSDDSETLGALGIDFSGLLIATDGDGDPLADPLEAGSFVIDIEDDVPVACDETVKPILDDEGLDGGINGGLGDTNGAATTATGTLNFSAGADGQQSFELTGPDTLGNEAVTSTWDPDTNMLTITSAEGRGDLMTVQVDPETGDYTVSLLQALRHEEGGHENNIHLNIGYTVTDGDGDSASATIRVNIDDDTPTISQSDVSDKSYVTFKGSDAGYANSYGYYVKGPDGAPVSGKVLWANVLDLDIGDQASLDGLNPEDVGFFIIPDGAENDGLSDGAELTFEFDGGKWHAVLDGVRLEGADGANVLFSDATLNPGGAHLQDTDHPGNQNWEDKTDTSDFDYNDVSISVTWGGQLQVDESDFDVDASRDFSGVFNVDAGADGQRSLEYELTLKGSEDGPVDSGLIDTETGESVFLSLVGTSTIEGRNESGELVFTVSVDDAGVVTLDQLRALKHPSTDPDEPIGLDAKLIGLKATVTDNDGDTASSTLDLGKLISFKDDGPTAEDDTPDALVEGESANVVSGNVLDNDSAGADGGKAFVGWNGSPANTAAIAELSKYGTLVLNPATGEYSFTLNNDDPDTLGLAEGETVSERVQYTMKDADGDISTAYLTISITGTNNGITLEGLDVNGGEVTVDEQHLPNGSAPDDGALTQTGSFSFESPDGLDTLTIDGVAFTFAQLQGATEGAPLVIESAGGVLNITGFTGTASGGTVSYAYTLENAVGHDAVQGPNTLTEQFEVVVTDRDGDSATGTIDVNIVDDVPDAKDNKVCIEGTGLPPYNLTLVLDSSGSMDDIVKADLDGNGTPENVTRLDVAKAALVNLINSYIALGVPLNFKVIDFDSSARLVYEGTDPAAAKAAINAMTEGGNTNYDAALDLARDELEQDLANSDLDDYENRLYFLSDGEPYPSGNGAPASWQDFVDDKDIDVITVGIQIPTGGNAENALEAVGNDGDSVIVVTDPNQLSATLDDTVPDGVTGNVISDVGTEGADVAGADGALSVISVTYLDADGNSQTVDVPAGGTTGPLETFLGGTLTMSSDGTYTYQAPANVTGDSEDVFTYTVKDADGDTDSANLTICIKDSVPVAKDNEASVVESGLPPFNLTLVLDSSGSMDDIVKADLDGDGKKEDVTRLDVAKVALVNLINSYIALGVPLNFKVIDFDSGARLVYEGTDPVAAKNAIDGMAEGGNTSYSNALALARDELEDDLDNPDLDDYENRLYFLSDGEPYPSGNGAPSGWQNFVDSNDIDVIAVGIQIPSNGTAATELGKVGNAGDTVIVVQDPNELSATLGETVPDSLEGNVITDAGPDGVDDPGTDGPISVVFVSYTDENGDEVTVGVPEGGSTGPLTTQLGGTLVIASDGSYTYSAPSSAPAGAVDVFRYTIADRDGDTSSADLTITIEDGGPVAKDDMAQAQEGYWTLSGNSTYTAQYAVHGGGPTTNVNIGDIDNAPNMGQKSSQSSTFTVNANAGAPAQVIFSASTGNWNSADRWDAELFRVGDSNPVAQLLNQTGNRSNASFDSITQSGQYYVKFTVRDNSGSTSFPGNLSGRADLDITKLQYTNPLQNVSVTAPGVVWVAALMASGNVLSNDNPGPDGGVSVTGVNGQDMEAGGLTLVGQYGTLYIAANGAYTYIPLTGDLPSGASDSFTYDIVDADGSTDSAVLTVGIKDTQYSSTGTSGNNLVGGNEGNNSLDGLAGNDVVYGGAGNDTLHGGNGNDNLMGGEGDDILYGGANDDVLNGGAGNDKLYGGAGNDWLIGGEGEDIFIWGAGETGIDVVADFQTGPNGDALDLSALLTGENAGNLESYLTFSFGPSTTIVADSNGASNGGNIQTIVLDGVDLGAVYGSTNAGDVIAGMLNDGSLVVNA